MRMASPHRNLERESVICELFRQGKTLQEVADVFHLTRERVRQILRRAGVAPEEGGIHKRSAARRKAAKARRIIERDARTQERFGCYHDELLDLNGGQSGWAVGSNARAYAEQRRNAEARGIEWSITFPEWMAVWEESGFLDLRGRGDGRYCMARHRDIGPYEVGNVYITTINGNAADYQAELKKRGVACRDGFKRLPEMAAIKFQD